MGTETPPPGIDISELESAPRTPLTPHAEMLEERREAAIMANKDRLEMLPALPDNAQTEAARRATYMNMYRKSNDKIALQITGEEWQKFLQSGPQLIEDMRSANVNKRIVSARNATLKNILSLTKPPTAGKTPSFDSARFAMTVEQELLDAKESLTVLTDETQKNAIQKEIDFLNAILKSFHLSTDVETIQQYDIFGRAKPDEKRQAWKQTGKNLAQLGVIVGAGTVFLGVLTATVFSGTENSQSALIWGAILALGLWGPELTKSKVEKIKDEMKFTEEKGFKTNLDSLVYELTFMQGRGFQDYSADHRGKLSKIAEKLFEKGNREPAMKALRTLLDERDNTKAEEKKKAARESLRSILGDDPETTMLLKDEQKFVAFALPILDHARSPEAQQLVLTYLSDARPPTLDTLSHTLPPTLKPPSS